MMGGGSMRKSFKDSLKALEADIQHANTFALNATGDEILTYVTNLDALIIQARGQLHLLSVSRKSVSEASDFPTEYDGACLQMRMSYSASAQLFLFLVQWTDCSLAGALGLIRIMIYKVHADGSTTMSTHERKATIKEFYTVIFPSVLQLQKGLTDVEDKRQKVVCMEKYRRRDDDEISHFSEIDFEREEECGICMEMNSKIVLPDCSHSMCMKCYKDWNSRSQSCPFCRQSLKRVDSGELWILIDNRDVVDMALVTRENIKRLIMYIKKLPLAVPNAVLDIYDSHLR